MLVVASMDDRGFAGYYWRVDLGGFLPELDVNGG